MKVRVLVAKSPPFSGDGQPGDEAGEIGFLADVTQGHGCGAQNPRAQRRLTSLRLRSRQLAWRSVRLRHRHVDGRLIREDIEDGAVRIDRLVCLIAVGSCSLHVGADR